MKILMSLQINCIAGVNVHLDQKTVPQAVHTVTQSLQSAFLAVASAVALNTAHTSSQPEN